jgi:FdhD protein
LKTPAEAGALGQADTIRAVDRTEKVAITRVGSDQRSDDDLVVVEEPLEIRIGNSPLAITMRTPGDDFDLALGFLLTEGIIHERGDVAGLRHWGSANVVRVELRDGLKLDLQKLQRHFYATSSCGVCGKASIDALRVHAERNDDPVVVSPTVLQALPALLRTEQQTFDSTGAIHGAAAFTAGGSLLVIREDIGRHNAADKVIGALLQDGRNADVLVVSGRAGFEIVQKAIVARIPIIASVGAPSSLAIALASEFNATLLGFVRDRRFNIYSGAHRVAPE